MKMRKCNVCNLDDEGKYKCPLCYVFYCSVKCCKLHRADGCRVLQQPSSKQPTEVEEAPPKKGVKRKMGLDYPSEDTVPPHKLRLLRENKGVTSLLTNPHLRTLIKTVDEASDPDTIMQKAMQEPIFVEFAEACLAVVDDKERQES